ncbi:MAG: D-alanyl-D-alanine carboxypeptidase/D-alanyl-D-alanine-endopeptidase [Planctomycetota bacterium]
MHTTARGSTGRRGRTLRRVILIVAANAACALVLWKVAGPRSSAASATATPSAAETSRAPSSDGPRATVDTLANPAPRPPRSAPKTDRELSARVRAEVQRAQRKAEQETKGKLAASQVQVAVHVRALSTADDVVAVNADRPLRPASNMKLVTTAAALVSLGPDWSFETRFESGRVIEDGTLRGDLVVRAGADPLYDEESDGSVERYFAPVARELVRQGISRIGGDLVLDEGEFQPPAPGPAWPADNQHWNEYCALAAGFSVNAGCLTAVVKPGGAAGRPAVVRVEPREHGLAPAFGVETGAPKSSLSIRVDALHGAARVEGSIPRDVESYTVRFAAPDPVALFGASLRGALERHGVEVLGAVRRARGVALANGVLRASIRTPISAVLAPINTDSNNPCADQLFLALGRAVAGVGTRAGGRAASARALAALSVDSAGLVQVDGSGLSRDNRVSARQITALLEAVLERDERTAQLYLDSLAVGNESGTLDDRMRAPELVGRVHAKTGFIAGTSALSGVLDTASGERLVFSILVEYPAFDGLNRSCWKPMQDAICVALATSGGG